MMEMLRFSENFSPAVVVMRSFVVVTQIPAKRIRHAAQTSAVTMNDRASWTLTASPVSLSMIDVTLNAVISSGAPMETMP